MGMKLSWGNKVWQADARQSKREEGMGERKPPRKSEISILCLPCCVAEKWITEKLAQSRGLPKWFCLNIHFTFMLSPSSPYREVFTAVLSKRQSSPFLSSLLWLSFSPLWIFLLSSPFAGTGQFLSASNTQTWVTYSSCLTTKFFIVLALQSDIPWVYFTEKMTFFCWGRCFAGLLRWTEDGGCNIGTKCLLVCLKVLC